MQYKWTVLSVTTIGTLMSGIDSRIAIIGLPTIAAELHVDAESVIWINQSYLLASTVGLLLIGRMTDSIGRLKIYNYGYILFTLGSAVASFSFTTDEVIFGRVIQGLGAAMLVTNGIAILTDSAPPQELGGVMGINQFAFRAGALGGLTLSGILLSFLDWRSLFYVNIPIGIFGFWLSRTRLREVSKLDTNKEMDWAGFATFTLGLTIILLGITYFGYGASNFLFGIELMLIGTAFIIAFYFIETRVRTPLLDLRLFKIREFAAGTLSQLLNGLAWNSALIIVSFYFQVALGYSPLKAGLNLLTLEITYSIFPPISGRLSDKYGGRFLASLGLGIGSLGLLLLSTVTGSGDELRMTIALAVLGVGNGLYVAPNINSVMGAVPINRRGIASAYRSTLLNVGSTTGPILAILLMTTAIPYDLLTQLIQNAGSQTLTLLSGQEFVNGFRIAALALCVANSVAIIPSALRGRREKKLVR